MERLLNAREVSKVLGGVSPENVLRMAKRGELPCINIGRRVRFAESELQLWIDEKKTNAKRRQVEG